VLNENLDKSLMAGSIGVHHASGRKDHSGECSRSIATSSTEEATQLVGGPLQIMIEREYANPR
jgi:hypothetical protein